MKLRNKKTGEIVETDFELSVSVPDDEKLYGNDTYTLIKGYSSIKELSEDWEDYEEPKEQIMGIDRNGMIVSIRYSHYEEAEKAVEKLKAWKRLKDCGFKFVGWKRDERYSGDYHIEAEDYDKCDDKDLDLIFGGEE